MSNYLAIDIGNTLQKAAVFSEDGKMLFFCDKEHLTEEDLLPVIEEFSVTHSILSIKIFYFFSLIKFSATKLL